MRSKTKKKQATFLEKVLLLSRIPRAIYLFQAFVGLWLFSAYLSRRFFHHFLGKFLLFLVGFQFMYYSVYIINDLIDYPKDKVDKALSHKPLVKGSVSKKDAVLLIFLHLFGGLFYFVIIKDFWGLLISFGAVIYNIFYTLVLKKHWFIRYLANAFTHALRLGLPIFWGLAYQLVLANSWKLFGVAEILYLLFVANLINFRRIMDGKTIHYVFALFYVLVFLATLSILKISTKIMLFFAVLFLVNIVISALFTSVNILRKLRSFFISNHL